MIYIWSICFSRIWKTFTSNAECWLVFVGNKNLCEIKVVILKKKRWHRTLNLTDITCQWASKCINHVVYFYISNKMHEVWFRLLPSWCILDDGSCLAMASKLQSPVCKVDLTTSLLTALSDERMTGRELVRRCYSWCNVQWQSDKLSTICINNNVCMCESRTDVCWCIMGSRLLKIVISIAWAWHDCGELSEICDPLY